MKSFLKSKTSQPPNKIPPVPQKPLSAGDRKNIFTVNLKGCLIKDFPYINPLHRKMHGAASSSMQTTHHPLKVRWRDKKLSVFVSN